MTRLALPMLFALPLVLSSGCKKGAEDIKTDSAEAVGAEGITITQVAIYQGPQRILAEDGEEVDSDVPLVQGRDALVRVFYEASDERVGEELTARLELDGGDSFEVTATIVESSEVDDLDSTLNFEVPGSAIGSKFAYRVSVLDFGAQDNPDAHHPQEGTESHKVKGPPVVFKLVLVPYAYNADGSGRVPDLGDEALQDLSDRFMQLYPLADVEITVEDPVSWSGTIQPNGSGWQEVGFDLYQRRASASPDGDVYYYGIFSPTSSFSQWCNQGCLNGVTLLNDSPSDTGDPNLRIAIGVGFSEYMADTMLHELGHSQGREHADCGPGLDPNSIDRDYPYDDGEIGVWSYDLIEGELVSPNHSDLMGYCDRVWISDYNYAAILTRASNIIEDEGLASTAQPAELVVVDGEGAVTWSPGAAFAPRGGESLSVQVRTSTGTEVVEARVVRFDHLPGAWVFLPSSDAHRAEFELDGQRLIVER